MNAVESAPADELLFEIGHASLCLKRSGEIILKNKHATVCLSAFGKVSIQGQADIVLSSAENIHLNCKN